MRGQRGTGKVVNEGSFKTAEVVHNSPAKLAPASGSEHFIERRFQMAVKVSQYPSSAGSRRCCRSSP